MSRCPNCHAPVDPGTRFCPECGELLADTGSAASGTTGDGRIGSSSSGARRTTSAAGTSPRAEGGGYPRPPTEEDTDVLSARVAALLLDGMLTGVLPTIVVSVAFVFALADGEFGLQVFLLSVPVVVLVMALYYVLLEGYWDGQTLGKRVFGIKVVKETGEPCDLEASLRRNLLRIVDGLFAYLVGFVVMWRNDRRQRVGDRVADTVVVRE